jgi:lipopolysaccharide transport system ATP-binding protein
MNSDVVIRTRNIGKMYRIGSRGPGRALEMYGTARDVISRRVLSIIHGGVHVPIAYEELWALRNITFDIHKGERVAIIGKNGAGKSTLLKVLSRITTPTEGDADVCGNVGCLLEIGPGLHPELTGEENIFLYGSILGMRKKEVDEKFDEIVKFAEIGDFIDVPLKRYSSGMWVRLGFGIVSISRPDILLLDETLSVSDAGFQKKALDCVLELSKEGCTVISVSHNENVLRSLCDRGILLERGKIISDGKLDDVLRTYGTL